MGEEERNATIDEVLLIVEDRGSKGELDRFLLNMEHDRPAAREAALPRRQSEGELHAKGDLLQRPADPSRVVAHARCVSRRPGTYTLVVDTGSTSPPR